jgi:hypothetical protein
MIFMKKKRILSILMSMVMTASLSVPVFADTIMADGDGLAPVVASTLNLGSVAAGSSVSGTVLLAIKRTGASGSTNVFKDNTTATIVSTNLNTNLSLSTPDNLIVIPSNWGTKDNNTMTDAIEGIGVGTASSTVTLTVPSGTAAGTYSEIIKYIATGVNSSGNNINPEVTVTVNYTVTAPVDTTAPVIASHEDITREATSSAGTMVEFAAPTANDAVDGSVAVTCNPVSGSTFVIGDTPVTCTATDAHGNKATSTFNVKVQDTTAPTITAPAAVIKEATAALTTVTLESATATDLVSSGADLKVTSDAPSSFTVGTTTVTWTATDKAGNKATAAQAVTITDRTAPVLTLPANITVLATKAAGADVTFVATAIDIVDGPVNVTYTSAPGSTFGLGTTTVNCTATDAHGNKVQGSFTVTVKYDFNGFYQPVDMGANVVNTVKSGSAIPVKFSLNGDRGLDIFATGYPKVIDAKFAVSSNYDEVESVVAATNSGLTYDNVTKTYTYVWKTDKSWTGASKQLVIKLKDGTTCTANFLFK